MNIGRLFHFHLECTYDLRFRKSNRTDQIEYDIR